jgi:hypothetical protein
LSVIPECWQKKRIIGRYDVAFKPLGIEVLNHYTDEYTSSDIFTLPEYSRRTVSRSAMREKRNIVKMAERLWQPMST